MTNKEKDRLIRQAIQKAIRLYFGRIIQAMDIELMKLEDELKLPDKKDTVG